MISLLPLCVVKPCVLARCARPSMLKIFGRAYSVNIVPRISLSTAVRVDMCGCLVRQPQPHFTRVLPLINLFINLKFNLL